MAVDRNDVSNRITAGIYRIARNPYAILFLLGLIITFPVMWMGLPFNSHDGLTNALYADNFTHQILLGEIYPRWLYLTNGGLGSPTFFSYQPLPSYIALFFKFVSTDSMQQLGVASSVGVILSGMAAFLWLKEISKPVPALIGAALYMVLPYPVGHDLYVRGAFGEGFTFIWMPLIMYFVVRLCRGDRRAIIGLAVSYALLCLTHLPVTVIFSAIPPLFILFLANREKRIDRLVSTVGGMILGSGIAAVYLIPVGAYESYAYLHELREGNFHYSFYLMTTELAVRGYWTYFWMPFVAVTSGIVSFLGGFFLNSPKRRRELVFWMLVLFASSFMLLEISSPIWATFRYLQAIQFPFRFNAVISVAVLPLFVHALATIRRPFKWHSLLLILFFSFLGLYLVNDLRKAAAGASFTQGPEVLAVREWIRRLQPETKGRWPRTVPFQEGDLEKNLEKIPVINGERARAFVTNGTAEVAVMKWLPRRIELQIDSSTQATINVSQFYFPGWRARIAGSGQELSVSPSPGLALVAFSVPPGKRHVNVTLDKLWPEVIAEWISGFSVLLTLVFGWIFYKRHEPFDMDETDPEDQGDLLETEPDHSASVKAPGPQNTAASLLESTHAVMGSILYRSITYLSTLVGAHQLLLGSLAVIFLYGLYISNLSTHPGGFYVDESCKAYNAYLIGTTGVAENGATFPLFYQCYTGMYTQWMSSPLMYLMAGMYTVVPPSILSARIFAATIGFLASLLLGFLAFRISGCRSVGMVISLIALVTPWLFEISRFVHETVWQGFTVVLFLFCLFRSYARDKWSASDFLSVGTSLALVTYAYAAGRVLAPLFAFGLIIFAVNRHALVGIIKTWAVYAVLLIPLVIVYFTNPQAVIARFGQVSKLSWTNSFFENASAVASVLSSDLSLKFLLYDGDQNARHHLPTGVGEFLVGAFALSILGLLIVLALHRSSPWWRFILFGTFVSLIPGAITEPNHALRGIAFPIFVITLAVPAVMWLLGPDSAKTGKEIEPGGIPFRRMLLFSLLALTLIQAAMFQVRYLDKGDERNFPFDREYPLILNQALAAPDRPIYLEEGPTYVHAYWYAVTQGIDVSSFVLLRDKKLPPVGSLVITGRDTCSDCEKIDRKGDFTLNRYTGRVSAATPPTAPR